MKKFIKRSKGKEKPIISAVECVADLDSLAERILEVGRHGGCP